MDQKIASLKARREFQERLRQGLVTRAVLISCDHCAQQVSGEMEWSCGYCNYENRRTTLYSFLHKCQKCDREPKSCVCPGCSKFIFLDEDNDATHPASKAQSISRAAPPEDLRAKKRKEHSERKEALEQELEITKLAIKLAQIKALVEAPKEETVKSRMKRLLKEKLDQRMGAFDAARECQKEAAEEFKDDPERLKDAEDGIQEFLDERSLDGPIT